MEFIRQAPVFGHSTGSIRALFEKSAIGQSGAAGVAAANPHNQTLAVAIQLGLVGVTVLWAMWIAHLLLFRGNGLAEWLGLVIVAQNLIGSLFNSHLFDFVQGWVYAVGVGVAGGLHSRAGSGTCQATYGSLQRPNREASCRRIASVRLLPTQCRRSLILPHPVRDNAHLRFVASRFCLVRGRHPSDPHKAWPLPGSLPVATSVCV